MGPRALSRCNCVRCIFLGCAKFSWSEAGWFGPAGGSIFTPKEGYPVIPVYDIKCLTIAILCTIYYGSSRNLVLHVLLIQNYPLVGRKQQKQRFKVAQVSPINLSFRHACGALYNILCFLQTIGQMGVRESLSPSRSLDPAASRSAFSWWQ